MLISPPCRTQWGMTSFNARVPAGVPNGGQFAATQRSESNVTLSAASPRQAAPAPHVPWEAPKAPQPKERASSSENPEMEMVVDFGAVKSSASKIFKRFRGR